MKKGLELPVNVLVVVSVAIIVLLGIIALFMGGFGSGADVFQKTSDWNEKCSAAIGACSQSHPNLNQLCGELGKYDTSQVKWDDVTKTFSLTATAKEGAVAGNTVDNGCNKACGCN